MTPVFADTFYWVALTHRDEQWHERVTAFSATLGAAQIFTTDEVFVELLAFFGTFGPPLRAKAAAVVRRVHNNPQVVVLPQTRATFMQGLTLYRAGAASRPVQPVFLLAGIGRSLLLGGAV